MKSFLACMLLALSLGAEAQKRPAMVFLTAGQSNTDRRVSNKDLPRRIREEGYRHCLWSYGIGHLAPGNGDFEPFRPRVAQPGDSQRWGYDAVLYYCIDQNAAEDFYVIKESVGGTALDTACRSTGGMYWNASPAFLSSTAAAGRGGRSLLKAFTEHIGACIDKRLSRLEEGYEIKALFWHQGESDLEAAGRYGENLKALVRHVRNYLVEKTGDRRYARLPVVCGTFARESQGRSEQIVEALEALSEEDADFHVVDAGDASLLPDRLHFDARGAELLGRRMFGKLKETGIIEERQSLRHSPAPPGQDCKKKQNQP